MSFKNNMRLGITLFIILFLFFCYFIVGGAERYNGPGMPLFMTIAIFGEIYFMIRCEIL